MMGSEFDKPARSNPKGYFEDVEFKNIFNRMTAAKEVDGSLKVLVKMRDAQYPLWGLKDPQLCLLLHKFLPLVKDCKIISTLRSKEDICDSLSRAMPELIREQAVTFKPLVDYYLDRKDEALSLYNGPLLKVDFGLMQSQSKIQIERIAEFVGVPVTQEALNHVQVA
jgi:hypothetical protein